MAILRTDIVSGIGGRNTIDGSLFFDGSGRLSVPNSEDVRVGSNDFTIEAWIRAENPGDWTTVLGMWDSSAGRRTYALQRKKSDSKLYFYVSADGGSTISATATQYAYGGDVTLGEWHHVAGVRDGNTIRAYLNGVEVGNASFTASILNNTTDALFIGDTEVTAGGEAFNGYMSNVRLIKGTCLYPSGTTFTPPTEKLTAVDGTVLLCCQDSDDPTQEATGKTITGFGNLDYSLRDYNLITNGNFDSSATDGWTVASGSASLGTGQSGTFGNGNHLVMTGGNMYQAFTTKIGRTYFVNAQSNGGDSSYISTSTSTGDAIITDIRSSPQTGSGVRGQKSFVATQTTYYVILTGGGGGGNFDTVSVYEAESPKAQKVLPSVGVDEGVTFEGDTKINSQGVMYFPTGDTSQRGRGRGLFAGAGPSLSKEINYIQIQSQGNTTKFGDLTTATADVQGGSSSTRGLFGAGGGSGSPGFVNTIEYVTIATTANVTDFGDLNETTFQGAALANDTRYVYGGGTTPTVKDVMDYVTIATTGNATDFGNLTAARFGLTAFSSPTRGIYAGGATPTIVNTIDYITIASAGNATDFGDVTSEDTRNPMGASSSTRGVIAGGQTNAPSNGTDAIDYITIATTGNTTDFGNLTDGRRRGSGLSNSIRGVFTGGYDPAVKNTIDYITIASTGNAQDFGDYSGASIHRLGTSASDSHGGLS